MEFITNTLRAITWTSIGMIIGFVIGISFVFNGVKETYKVLPTWVTIVMFFVLSIGVFVLISYLRPETIEKIRSY